MLRSEIEIKAERDRLKDGILFADKAIIEFEDDPQLCHNFIVLKAKYNMKLKTIKWVLNESP